MGQIPAPSLVRKLEFTTLKPKKGRKNAQEPDGDSSESDAELSVHDSSLDFSSFYNDEENDQEEEIRTSQKIQNSPSLLLYDYAVAKAQGKTKNSIRHYVTKIISTYYDKGYEGVFYKKLSDAPKFTETNEELFIDIDDTVLKLSKSTRINSAWFHNTISFSEDLIGFNIY